MNHQRNPGEVGGVCNLNWKRPEDSLCSGLLHPLSSANRLRTGGIPQTRLEFNQCCKRGRRLSDELGRDRFCYCPLKGCVLQRTRNDLVII